MSQIVKNSRSTDRKTAKVNIDKDFRWLTILPREKFSYRVEIL
jgi:hypothetical protein